MEDVVRDEILAGVLNGAGVAAAVVVLGALFVGLRHPERVEGLTQRAVDFGGIVAPVDVRAVAEWSVASADARGAPFAVIDKRRAHLYVFDAAGRLRGLSPVLLGYAPGDDSVPGIGDRPIDRVTPSERTTPAGRFEVASGRNRLDEEVIWVDYGHAVSMHRVRVTDPTERRLERLASPSADDNRISYGCINVPASFFEAVVWPTLAGVRGVVYVLPEVKPLQQVFPSAAARVGVLT